MHTLIMSEYHVFLPDTVPVYYLQQLAAKASARRNERLKAANENRVYHG